MNSPDRPFRFMPRARPRATQPPPFRRKILCEALEPRVLLSADLAAEQIAFLLVKDREQDAPQINDVDAAPSAALIVDFGGAAAADLQDESWIVDVPARTDGAVPPIQSQVVFLDLDGAQGVDYDGPVRIADVEVEAFEAPQALAGQEAQIVAAMLEALQSGFGGLGVASAATGRRSRTTARTSASRKRSTRATPTAATKRSSSATTSPPPAWTPPPSATCWRIRSATSWATCSATSTRTRWAPARTRSPPWLSSPIRMSKSPATCVQTSSPTAS